MTDVLDFLLDPSWLVDFVIAVVVCEFVVVCVFAWWRGLAPFGLAANLSAGACLLLTARAALAGDRVTFFIMLSAAGVAHALDLICRWRGKGDFP